MTDIGGIASMMYNLQFSFEFFRQNVMSMTGLLTILF